MGYGYGYRYLSSDLWTCGPTCGPTIVQGNTNNNTTSAITKNKSLIYESMGIALVGENRGAIGARSGINKVQVET